MNGQIVDHDRSIAAALNEFVSVSDTLKRNVLGRDLRILEQVNVCSWRSTNDRWIVIENRCLAPQRASQHAYPPITSQLFTQRDKDPDGQADRAQANKSHDVALFGRRDQEPIDWIEQQSTEHTSHQSPHHRRASLSFSAFNQVHTEAQCPAVNGPCQASQNDESDEERSRPLRQIGLGKVRSTRQNHDKCKNQTNWNDGNQ